MRIYTRRGDDGTTGLLYGGRVPKDAARIEVNGAVDEAQAALGLARAEAEPGSELDQSLVEVERQLYVLMAEVATAPANRHKLTPGQSLVTPEMVESLERRIDDLDTRVEMPKDFVVPGANRRSAALDVARTLVRRAERVLVTARRLEDETGAGPAETCPAEAGPTESPDAAPSAISQVGPYLNRLSDLLWMMARWQEGDEHTISRRSGGAGDNEGQEGSGR